MKFYLTRVLALTLTLSVASLPVLSEDNPPTTQAQRQAGEVTTAVLIGAEQTRQQVARADATIQALYNRLEVDTSKARVDLRHTSLSIEERRKLETDLARLRAEQDALLAQFAAEDVEYAASIRAYREGLTGLLADNDPRIVDFLGRYADGDAHAADELQELTRTIRKSLDAGNRVRIAADQRNLARILLDEKDKGRKTTAQALAAWQEAASIDSADFWQWIEIARLQQESGNLIGAREAADQARAIASEKREHIAALNEIGDISASQGRLGVARTAYEESLVLSRALLAVNLNSAEEQRDVSLSLDKIGDVALSQGRLADASTVYEESLVIRRALQAANPNSTEAKHDVTVSLGKVGDVAVSQGRLGDARTAYEETLTLRRALLTSNSSSAQAKRDVSVILSRIGDVAVSQGRLADASKAYEETLALGRALLAANPSSAEAKRDISLYLERWGQVEVSQGHLSDARTAHEESLVLRRALLAADPSSAEAKRDVIASHVRLFQFPDGNVHVRPALLLAEEMARDGVMLSSDQPGFEWLRALVKTLDGAK